MADSKSPRKTWIAFLDLLGTKNSSRIKKSEFPTKISTFSRTIQEQAAAINCNVKIRFFSDSAYVEGDDILELSRYAARLRFVLFSQEIFFKAAISPGVLDDRPSSVSEKRKNGYDIDIQGASFGESAVTVYYNQENFKGVGFFLDTKEVKPQELDCFCESAFPVSDDLKKWTSFFDIKYDNANINRTMKSKEDVNGFENALSYLDILLENALRANFQKNGLSRYYISNFLTLINSSDFSKLSVSDDEWCDAPPVFYHMLMSKKSRLNYATLRGGHTLFFALLHKTLSTPSDPRTKARYLEKSGTSICDRLISQLSDVRLPGGFYDRYPPAVISHDVAEELTRRMVALKML